MIRDILRDIDQRGPWFGALIWLAGAAGYGFAALLNNWGIL